MLAGGPVPPKREDEVGVVPHWGTCGVAALATGHPALAPGAEEDASERVLGDVELVASPRQLPCCQRAMRGRKSIAS